MFPDHFLVGCSIHAVNFVAGDVAVDPLDLRDQLVQHTARFLRNRMQLVLRQFPRAGDFTLNEVFRHSSTSRILWISMMIAAEAYQAARWKRKRTRAQVVAQSESSHLTIA